MPGDSSEELAREIKRIEARIKEIHHRIKTEVNEAPQLFDFAETETELRALEVRLREFKQNQAKDA